MRPARLRDPSSGGKLTITSGTGTCKITAHKAGNDNYNPADSAEHTVTVSKANQTITVGTAAPASAVFDTSFTVAATASSGLTVATPSRASAPVDPILTMTSGTGSCTVKANQAGNDNYNAADEVTKDVTPKGRPDDHATACPASEGLRHQLHAERQLRPRGSPSRSRSRGVCTRDSGTGVVTMTSGTGTCTVYANQAGNDNYNPAPRSTKTSTPSRPIRRSTSSVWPTSKVYNGTFTPTASSTSGLTVAITVTGVCTRDPAPAR